MQTDSSASFTCIAWASAVECTATVAMPNSFAARKMRRAISPRIGDENFVDHLALAIRSRARARIFDRLPVLDENRGHDAAFGATMSLKVFIASISSSLSPAETRAPISTKALASGLGRK